MRQILSLDRVFAGTQRWLVKLTILVEGVYYHPRYGRLDYSAPVLAQIKENHDRDVLGYRIPLYIGHALAGEERPAVGYLLPNGLSLEPDAEGRLRLFGVFELIRQDVYEQIWRGEYSYGSAELVSEGILDKTTGEPVGPVLVAHTLTCTPFIPDMVPNQVLSLVGDAEPVVPFTLLTEQSMNDKEMQAPQTEPSSTEAALGLVQEAFAAYRAEAERRIQELSARCDELNKQLQEVLAQKRQAELDALVKEIQSLNLPAATKEKYIPLIRENGLSDTELSLLMDNLRTISQHMAGLMFTQYGMGGPTPEQPDQNPFAHIIEANRRQAQARQTA